MVSERTMNSMPNVAMKLGIAKVSVMNPFAKPDGGGEQKTEQDRREGRHAGDDQERRRHRRQRERGADGKIELAADHQNRDADRDEPDLRQQPENAAQIVRPTEKRRPNAPRTTPQAETAAQRPLAPAFQDKFGTDSSRCPCRAHVV